MKVINRLSSVWIEGVGAACKDQANQRKYIVWITEKTVKLLMQQKLTVSLVIYLGPNVFIVTGNVQWIYYQFLETCPDLRRTVHRQCSFSFRNRYTFDLKHLLLLILEKRSWIPDRRYFRGLKTQTGAGIFQKSMGARPARLQRPAEFIPWNQFRGPINIPVFAKTSPKTSIFN